MSRCQYKITRYGNGCNKELNTDEMVYTNTQVTLGGMISINDFNKNQLDTQRYTYPYNIQNSTNMKPLDCQPTFQVLLRT